MIQIRHIVGSSENFALRVNNAIKAIENHHFDVLNSITYNTTMITTGNGIDVQYDAFLEVEVISDDDKEEDSYLGTLNDLMKDRNFNSDGCR